MPESIETPQLGGDRVSYSSRRKGPAYLLQQPWGIGIVLPYLSVFCATSNGAVHVPSGHGFHGHTFTGTPANQGTIPHSNILLAIGPAIIFRKCSRIFGSLCSNITTFCFICA